MSAKERSLAKTEAPATSGVERVENKKVFIPPVDIVETKKAFILTADLPGVNEKAVEVSLEKRVLTIRGSVTMNAPEGCRPLYAEYEIGDYQRSFTLSEDVNRDGIKATVRNGVLKLVLPKAEDAAARKIVVESE
jgi:HSP20 family molecular chaperone IbpA